jgi:DNA-binding transcriptional LysR family regulator
MNDYDVFIWVVRLGSFSAAAKKIHRTPSAISRQISTLEQKLDTQLFDRTTRSLSVTKAGAIYFERCIDISQRINNAKSELKELSGEASGRINITFPHALSYSPVIDVLSSFTKKYPNIHVNLNITDDILNLIDEGIDIAFRVGPLADSSMIGAQIFDLSPVLCATPRIVKEYGLPETFDELAKFPQVLPSYINLSKKLRQYFHECNGLRVNENHLVNNITAIHQMTKKGMGIAFLFRDVVERDLEDGTLVDLCPNIEMPSFPVFLMYHRLDYTAKRIDLLIDFVRDYFS